MCLCTSSFSAACSRHSFLRGGVTSRNDLCLCVCRVLSSSSRFAFVLCFTLELACVCCWCFCVCVPIWCRWCCDRQATLDDAVRASRKASSHSQLFTFLPPPFPQKRLSMCSSRTSGRARRHNGVQCHGRFGLGSARARCATYAAGPSLTSYAPRVRGLPAPFFCVVRSRCHSEHTRTQRKKATSCDITGGVKLLGHV